MSDEQNIVVSALGGTTLLVNRRHKKTAPIMMIRAVYNPQFAILSSRQVGI